MKIVEHIRDIPEPFVLTIGNFDGLHLGHQELLRNLLVKADLHGAKTCIITFSPHPYEILKPQKTPFLISSYEEKMQLVERINLDYFVLLKFNQYFSSMNPDLFVKNYLESSFLKAIHLGENFTFGVDRKGNFQYIKHYFKEKTIDITEQKKLSFNGKSISSTIIRKLISSGKVCEVKDLLGRNFSISGTVVRGHGRRKQIGFPTANIKLHEAKVCPEFGVYITETKYKKILYHSITNIGVSPTFGKSNKKNIETNIFNFDREIYNEKIEVNFLKKIRDEIRFSEVNDLILQIEKDIQATKEFFQC